METATRAPAKKLVSGRIIAVAAVTAAIIIFAFIWEAVLAGREDVPIPGLLTDVQGEIEKLDWITRDFLPVNDYSRPGTPLPEVNAIVIHYVGNPNTTARQNRSYFETSGEFASSNFIVDLDGSILQIVPIDEVAYCTSDRNYDTLSIECCHPDATGEFSEETYASAVRLTAWLCKKLGLTPGNLMRHYDATGKECPKYYVDNPEAWNTFKSDVSKAYMEIPA